MTGLTALGRAIVHGGFDLIVCEPNYRAPWNPVALSRILFSRRALAGKVSVARPFGLQLLRRGGIPPLAVVDLEDWSFIDRSDLYLLDSAKLYFKRELPADPWRLFAGTVAARLPGRRFRANPANLRRVEKLRPISLGIPPEMEAALPVTRREKTADVFFAGNVQGLPVREQGLEELKALVSEGVVVDIPERRLDRREFYERCAAARMVWSPEGFGWDCFRHYEAAACGSVPLVNYPPVRRYRPLQHGESCLLYGPEPGGLRNAILSALEDKARLAAMAENAREHAMRFHRREAMGRHIVESCLAQAAEPEG
jgi:hypothetical protein